MTLIVVGAIVFVVLLLIGLSARIVPQREVKIVERLGRYHNTLDAGFHLIVPLVDRVAYAHSLKEFATDVPPQACITKDNIQVEVDGVLYFQIVDPVKASYGVNDFQFASVQLAQTTMRSEMGKIELDRTFEERELINQQIVSAIDRAAGPWGVKVTRYEIRNIVPPQTIRDAMEKQMRAERTKRALIAESEGERQAQINRAEGEKAEAIARSEGERTKRINEAEGRAAEIERVATATAAGIRSIAEAISAPGGAEAVRLRVAEQYLNEFGKLAQTNNTMIVPANLTDLAGMVSVAGRLLGESKEKGGA
jgi:regulator of protease activity HflC (stomatin/prohibitin superfamily)